MSAETLRLDCNAAAGLLEQVFAFDVTVARSTCAGCGQTSPLGTLLLYGGEMGAVLRCPSCESVQMRVVQVREGYVMEMQGVVHLEIPPTVG